MAAKILLIDDSEIGKIVTKFMANLPEFAVEWVRSGKEGIEKAREMRPDLIVLDINFPSENGWEIAEQLKRGEATGRIPILIASGAGSPFETHPYVEPDLCEGYIRKPYDMQELLSEIRRILGSGAKPRASSP